jgi:hypothetical protein
MKIEFKKTGSKESQKELIKEIMDLDAKDGLYDTVNDTAKKLIEQAKQLEAKAKQTLYTEEQVNQKMIDFAEWCRTQYKVNGDVFLIEQLFSEYKLLRSEKTNNGH